MAASKDRSTRAGRYGGPPGDETVYLLPRDHDAWDASWATYLGQKALPLGSKEDPEHDRQPVDMSPEAVAERARKKARHAEAMTFIKGYTGTFGLILDIRANPKWGTKYLRLSERQVDAVLASRDRDLARIEQAQVNTDLANDDEYRAWKETPDEKPAPPQAPRLAPQRPAGTPVAEGIYVVDGEPWKAQLNREKTRLYAKRLVPDPDGGKGSWEYVPGGLSIIAHRGSPMTVDEASTYGSLHGICAVCGRGLTNEVSIERAIGPVCYARLG